MLIAESIQINRYKGIDNDKITIVSEEIATLKLLSKLDKLKEQITQQNRQKPNYRKGFSSNYHNFNRLENSYSIAESLFRQLLNEHCLNDFIHEFPIKLHDSLMHTHNYHIDFYFPALKLAIEINPAFHYTYQTVAIRDIIKTNLLKRKAHVKTLDVKVIHKVKKGKLLTMLDIKTANKTIRQIKQLMQKPANRELITTYLNYNTTKKGLKARDIIYPIIIYKGTKYPKINSKTESN